MDKREQFILDRLDQQGACSYEELAGLLDVSTMTVRRDVEQLAKGGRVIKTLGGVQRADAPSHLYETALRSRVAQRRPQKRAIAELALELIIPRQTVYLDGSTTCLELAKLIAANCRDVTVVTNSAAVCLELCRTDSNTVLGIGGQCDAATMCFVGPESEKWAGTYFVEKAFISTKAFLPAEGTFESSVATFRVKQVMAERCNELVLLVDSSKFGHRALSKVIDVSQIHVVVTDDETAQADLSLLAESGKDVRVAAVGDHSAKGAVHAS